MMDQVQKFRIFGLACNHTNDSPSEDRSAIWLVFDHIFLKIFGEKWWCPYIPIISRKEKLLVRAEVWGFLIHSCWLSSLPPPPISLWRRLSYRFAHCCHQ